MNQENTEKEEEDQISIKEKGREVIEEVIKEELGAEGSDIMKCLINYIIGLKYI